MKYFKSCLRANNFTDAVMPLYFILKITCQFPYRFVKENKKYVVKCNLPYILLVSIMMLIFIMCFVMLLLGDINFNFRLVTLLKKNDYVYLIINFIVGTFYFVNMFVQLKATAAKFEIMHTIDDLVSRLNIDNDYDKLKLFHIIILILLPVIHFTYMFIRLWYRNNSSALMIFTINGPMYTSMTSVVVFILFVRIATLNFDRFNETLCRIRANFKNKNYILCGSANAFTTNARKTYVVDNLQLLMKAYNVSCDFTDILNNNHGIQILLTITIAFIVVAINLFFVLKILNWFTRGVYTEELLTNLLISFYQCFIHIFNFMCIVIACNNCEVKANDIALSISKWLAEETDQITTMKLQQFLMVINHRKPKFTAHGLFDVNNSLLFTMTGSMSTYLIILIQIFITSCPKAKTKP